MAKSILNITNISYRATLEEQDDTIVWLVQTLKANGANTDLLLRGSCVNYGVITQNPKGLKIGNWEQINPPDLLGDLKTLHDKGAKIYFLEEDAGHLGIEKNQLPSFFQAISENKLAKLFNSYDYVWQW